MLASSAGDRGFGFKWLLNLYTLVLVFDKDAAVMDTAKDCSFSDMHVFSRVKEQLRLIKSESEEFPRVKQLVCELASARYNYNPFD